MVEIIGYDKAQNRVAKKLEPLVVRDGAVFVRVGAMRQSEFQ